MAGGRLIPGSQYGEIEYIIKVLDGKRDGLLLDVGAADGYHHSNAFKLVTEYGWRALLMEPHPDLFSQCVDRYAANVGHVIVLNRAVKSGGDRAVVLHLYDPPYYGQVSTTVEEFREQVVQQHGDQYARHVTVECGPLSLYMQAWSDDRYDFVNIDCEGCEVDALTTFPWETQRPALFCVEMAYRVPEIEAEFDRNKYRRLSVPRQIHNALYVPEEAYDAAQRRIG